MFIDSVVWIALKYVRDKWHESAVELREIIKKAPKILITEAIITETYNFLLRKSSFKNAYATYVDLIYSKDIQILESNSISRIGTVSILQNYNHLSYTDANLVWHSQITGIKEIMSFDDGFDDIENISRIY